MQYILINESSRKIEGVFDRAINHPQGKRMITLKTKQNASELIGKTVGVKEAQKMKIAVVCNWRTPCGISTYTQYLIEALRPKVQEIKIFSETEAKADMTHDQAENVVRCWKRGESMIDTIKQIKDWKADFVIIQHEFGIFPKATHFLKMIQTLENTPYAIVLHSVYGTHLDKTICTSAIKNIIVHSPEAQAALENLGHTTNFTQVIPHGCVEYTETKELWNIFQTPYAICQFGFGFRYKGVDRAIEAIGLLKQKNPEKYKDIFYCYLCSESVNAGGTHEEYNQYLTSLIQQHHLQDNVAIIRKYHSEQIINTYLRTAKLALFPYVTDPNNIVFGASGAIRIAMANHTPVIASESHMFDDLRGVIPRPESASHLADEINKIFSDSNYKNKLIERNKDYIRENNWNTTANRYLAAIGRILDKENIIEIIT